MNLGGLLLDRRGKNMSKLDVVWQKGSTVRGKNPDTWRKDSEGNLIRRGSYGTCGEYAWHVDHIRPKALGGSDNIRNLQPLHWEENLEKGKKYPY